jgi:hypothetical protein
VYVVDGSAGAYQAGPTKGASCEQPRPPFAQPTVRALDCVWGWATLSATPDEMRWQRRRWDTGEVTDELTLARP